MAISEAEVRSALGALVDPNTGKDYVSSRSVKGVKVSGSDVDVDLELGYPGRSQYEPLRREVVSALKKAGAANVQVSIDSFPQSAEPCGARSSRHSRRPARPTCR